jgi:probable HAF family extracellular repeat protein
MSFSEHGTEAFRWEAGVMTGLGDLPGGDFYSHAFDVSGDGTTVVGISRIATHDAAFRWKDGVMTDLAEGTPFESTGLGQARAANHDGSVIVGSGWRWENGVVTILPIPEGALWIRAHAVSPDGSVVVGIVTYNTSPLTTEALLWRDDQVFPLGDLPGGAFESSAADVSADGRVVVGTGRTAAGDEAFIWTPAAGMRRVREVLIDDFNLDLTGWTLALASGVSADGLTIASTGLNPLGRQEAWIAHIGCALGGDFNNDARRDGDGEVGPADLALFVDALLE